MTTFNLAGIYNLARRVGSLSHVTQLKVCEPTLTPIVIGKEVRDVSLHRMANGAWEIVDFSQWPPRRFTLPPSTL